MNAQQTKEAIASLHAAAQQAITNTPDAVNKIVLVLKALVLESETGPDGQPVR